MSDVMLFGVLRMPYEMAMGDELSRRQFYDRVQEALPRLAAATDLLEALRQANEESKLHDQHPGRWGHVIAKATGEQQ